MCILHKDDSSKNYPEQKCQQILAPESKAWPFPYMLSCFLYAFCAHNADIVPSILQKGHTNKCFIFHLEKIFKSCNLGRKHSVVGYIYCLLASSWRTIEKKVHLKVGVLLIWGWKAQNSLKQFLSAKTHELHHVAQWLFLLKVWPKRLWNREDKLGWGALHVALHGFTHDCGPPQTHADLDRKF